MPETISSWQQAVHQTAAEKGWHDNDSCVTKATPQSPPLGVKTERVAAQIALIHSEASEALEALRDGHVQLYTVEDKYGRDKPEGVVAELADVVIRCMDLCGALGLDLEEAMSQKHAYNQTRPRKHGGKAI